MAQTQSDEHNPERAMAGKQIAEALERAQTALNRYDHTRKQLAAQNINPDENIEAYEALITLDAAVHDAYMKLRKYLRSDIEDDWWNTKILGWIDNDTPIVLGGNEGEAIEIEDEDYDVEGEVRPADVKFLEDYQGEVQKIEQEQYVRHEGYQTVTEFQPALMPVQAYRRALRYLDEMRNELGFAPEAKRKTPRTEITEEMLDDVEEWRQENLPEEKLNGSS